MLHRTTRQIALCIIALLFARSSLQGQQTDESGFQLKSMTRSPLTKIIPGGVAVFMVHVTNESDTENVARLDARVSGYPDRVFSRDIRLPPKSQRRYELFVRIPIEAKQGEKLELVVDATKEQSGRYVQIQAEGKPITQSLPIPVEAQLPIPGLEIDPEPMMKPAWYWPPTEQYHSYEHFRATCVDNNTPTRTASFNSYLPSASQIGWDSLDWFVVGDSKFLSDAASLESLHRFVQSGGTLWLMLDKVPTELVRPLLSGEQMIETVDETELNEFVIECTDGSIKLGVIDRQVSLKRPCRLKRVVVSNARVTHQIGEWPVAFQMECGAGRIFATTLDSAAWIEPRTVKKNDDPLIQSDFQNRVWASLWTRDLVRERAKLPLLAHETQYPTEFIGSPIPPRNLIVGVLFAFCCGIGALAVLGLFRGDMRYIGYIVPIVSVLVSLGLFATTRSVRKGIPETVAKLQLMEIADDGMSASIREHAAVYLESSSNMMLEGQTDGLAHPDPSVTSGIKGFSVQDFGHWTLSNDAWPPGVWKYTTRSSVTSDRMQAIGTLTKQGLVLKLPDGFSLEDPVVNDSPASQMLCQFDQDQLIVDGKLNVQGERWFTNSLVTNEQSRRAQVYNAYFDKSRRVPLPNRRLYGWTQHRDSLSKWNRSDLVLAGSCLVSMPILIQRPEPGAEIFVPHGMISIRHDRESNSTTSVFNEISAQWAEQASSATEAAFEYRLPPELMPLEPLAFDFDFDVSAPQRVVKLFILEGGQSKLIVTLNSPSVPWKSTITDPEILRMFQKGMARLQVVIGEQPNQAKNDLDSAIVNWRVSHLRLSVAGRVLRDSNLSSDPQ